MIKRYLFGEPIIDTEGVLDKPEPCMESMPYFSLESTEAGLCLECPLEKNAPVYGLGQNVRGINKRGFRYVHFTGSNAQHVDTLASMYGSHNFLVVSGETMFGIFVDSPGRVIFDVGFSDPDKLTIISELDGFEVYIIEGTSLKEIVREFRQLIGQSYIPPKWAFGYQQCRWGYESSNEVRKVATEMQAAGIPLDSIGLDIDYMDGYKNFTADPEKYGDLAELSKELGDQGIRLVPIIDAGTKIEKGNVVYDEGVEKGYFVKDEEGNDFVGAVWPGRCHFPDFLRPEVRDWFGHHYKYLTDMGIEGFWNDMNEPTLFFTNRGLKHTMDVVDEVRDTQLDIKRRRKLIDTVGAMRNNLIDYKSFYHNVDGKKIVHDKVHNLYGYNMARAASEALDDMLPNHRTLVFSRSSCIGLHRYAGIWQGDNQSWWQHILLNMKMMPSLNMCGFLFTGADVGGFHGNTSDDLLIRWLQLAVFTPLMRNHSANSCNRQEPYLFKQKDIMRDMIKIRYMLLPYLYSEFVKCALNGDMMFRPLAFDYSEDKMAAEVEDQVMVGDALMIAPIYTQNANGRYVYLPEDMVAIRLSSSTEREYIPMKKGHHYISAELNQMVFFLRKDKILTLGEPAVNVDHMNFDNIEVLCNVETESQYSFYDDDGFTKDYDNPKHHTTICVSRDAKGELILETSKLEMNFKVTDVTKK